MAERIDWRQAAIILVIVLGGLLRWGLWVANPPNNTYDDYLTPIARYTEQIQRPEASACWECYQPPAYFVVAGLIARGVNALNVPEPFAWKLIQLLGAILSVAALWLGSRTLLLWFPRSSWAVMLGVCFIAVLPRDLYTSAMITNDVLLIFFVSLAVWSYSRVVKLGERLPVLWLGIATVGACWTKQSGLIALVLPLGLCWALLRAGPAWGPRSWRRCLVVCLLAACAFGVADEIVRWTDTGRFLVSNQDYFPWAANQAPGSLEAISFSSLRIGALFRNPFMGAETIGSFWTQLFARAWFDYESRFFAHGALGHATGRAGFALGLVVSILIAAGAVRSLARLRGDPSPLPLYLLALAYLVVPLVQTLRFPYYSSMKLMFVLPALPVIAIWLASATEWVSSRRAGRQLAVVLALALVAFGIAHLAAVLVELPESLKSISGPVWRFPPLR